MTALCYVDDHFRKGSRAMSDVALEGKDKCIIELPPGRLVEFHEFIDTLIEYLFRGMPMRLICGEFLIEVIDFRHYDGKNKSMNIEIALRFPKPHCSYLDINDVWIDLRERVRIDGEKAYRNINLCTAPLLGVHESIVPDDADWTFLLTMTISTSVTREKIIEAYERVPEALQEFLHEIFPPCS